MFTKLESSLNDVLMKYYDVWTTNSLQLDLN